MTPLVSLQHLGLSQCNNLTDEGLDRFKTLATSLNLEIVR
ncbi:hypothetical protein DB44_BG00190 [Candidatus Protochlamydia amoebophila]|uniref:Uncharacterized protein n=1 Tax=Candidatus Protochlamydia amoebophila TaxID=362787 RepID=A0A0C1JQ20_9BACT|nr:hypothetical protein DB44_BG00190 [Candidatus Protochlamydia amoebophila]